MIYLDKRVDDGGSGSSTSAVILQSQKHTVQIILGPEQLKSLVAGLGQPVSAKTESGSGPGGEGNLTVCGQVGEGGSLGPVGIALLSLIGTGVCVNEMVAFKNQLLPLRSYIPQRLGDLWKKYGECTINFLVKKIRDRRRVDEQEDEKKKKNKKNIVDIEMQDLGAAGGGSDDNKVVAEMLAEVENAEVAIIKQIGDFKKMIVKKEPRDDVTEEDKE